MTRITLQRQDMQIPRKSPTHPSQNVRTEIPAQGTAISGPIRPAGKRYFRDGFEQPAQRASLRVKDRDRIPLPPRGRFVGRVGPFPVILDDGMSQAGKNAISPTLTAQAIKRQRRLEIGAVTALLPPLVTSGQARPRARDRSPTSDSQISRVRHNPI